MPRSFSRGAVKTTITLPEQSVEVLNQLAEERGVSIAEVIRQAVAMQKYLSDTHKEGGRVLVEDPKKLITEIVIF